MILIDDLNRELGRIDYDVAMDELGSCLAGLPGVLAFGQFGEVSEPGVSDLDVIILVDINSLSIINEAVRAWMVADPIRSYLLPHPPLVIAPDMLPFVARHHTMYNLRWIQCYQEVVIPGATDDQREYLELVWTGFLVTTATTMMMHKKVGLRKILLLLKNIHQSCENLSKIIGKPGHYKEASINLRQEAMTSSQGEKELLINVERRFYEGLEILLGLIDRFGELVGPPIRGTKPIVVNRRLYILPAKESRINRGHHWATLWLNDSFIGVVAGSIDGRWQLAANAYELSERHIASLAVPSPFLRPFVRATRRPSWRTALLQALIAIDLILEKRLPVSEVIAMKRK